MVTKDYMRNRILVALGGTVAEEIMYGPENITVGASGDIQQITDIARGMIQKFGFGKSKVIRNENDIKAEVEDLVGMAYKQTKSMLSTYRDKLDLIAMALIENETLDSKQLSDILKN